MTVDEFARAVEGLQPRLVKGVGKALDEHAQVVAKTAAGYLGEYQPGWPALAPSTIAKHGDTPLLDTGEMKASVNVEKVSTPGAVQTDSIGTSKEYGVFSELGTVTQPPRPWLSLALTETYPALERTVDEAVDEVLDDVFGRP